MTQFLFLAGRNGLRFGARRDRRARQVSADKLSIDLPASAVRSCKFIVLRLYCAKPKLQVYDCHCVTSWIFDNETFHRCLVPECESIANSEYDSVWVKDVLPGSISDSFGHFIPEICSKFVFNNDSSYSGNQSCAARWFDHEQEKCSEWVFDKAERTIVNDVSKYWSSSDVITL